VSAFVVEDEPIARRALRELLAEVEWIRFAGEAADGLDAIRQIDALEPEIVFLDVQIPEVSGIEVLDRIRHDPLVVFTTAFDRYAVAAFEHDAIDYLVKPFGRRRFAATLERVRTRLATSHGEPAAHPPREPGGSRRLRRLFVRRGSRIIPLPVGSITRIEVSGDGVAVWSGSDSFHLARSLGDLAPGLDPERFRRIHRSQIVNLDHVRAMEFEGRNLVLTLADGTRVVASRSASQELRALLG
jgi:two-component system LytT family response regulator